MTDSPAFFNAQAVSQSMVDGASFGQSCGVWAMFGSYRLNIPDFDTHLSSARTSNRPTMDVIPAPSIWRFGAFDNSDTSFHSVVSLRTCPISS